MRKSCGLSTSWGLPRNSNAHKAPCNAPISPPGSAFCSVGWMIRRRSNPSSCRSGISVSCGLRKPTKSRAAKMPCAMCNSLRCAAASLASPLSASTLRLPAATGRTATPARNARASASIIRPTCKPLLHGSARSFWHRRSTSRERSRRNTAMNIWARSSAAVRRYLKICGLSLSRKRLSETSTPLKTVLTGAGIPTRGRSTAATMMRHAKRCISSTN